MSNTKDLDQRNINQSTSSIADGYTGNETTNIEVDNLLVKKWSSNYSSKLSNPFTKKIFSWFMVVTGYLIILLTISGFFIYFYILKTYLGEGSAVAYFHSFLPVLFFIILGLHFIKIGKGDLYQHYQMLKVTIKHLVSILFGLLIINIGTFFPLFILSFAGERLSFINIKRFILEAPLLMLFTFGMVFMGAWVIVRSVTTWRKAVEGKSPNPEQFGPLII